MTDKKNPAVRCGYCGIYKTGVQLCLGAFGYRQALFTDTSALTASATLVEEFGTTHMSGLVDFDRIDVGRKERKYSFYTYTIRDLSDRKAGGMTRPLLFDHIAFKGLDSFFVPFDDLVVYGNVVAGLKSRELLFGGHLFVYVGNSVHDPMI